MKQKIGRTQEDGRSIEWDHQVISRLNLPAQHVSEIDTLLVMTKNHCSSIVLAGSWANGTARAESDIDLLFISKDVNRKRELVTITKEFEPESHEIVFDIKILCPTEIRQMSSSSQHFPIWSLVSNGLVLYGRDPKGMVIMKHDKIRSFVFDILNELNEYATLLESNTYFVGACIYFAYIARTLYFLERDILGILSQGNKITYVKELLGASYNQIEKLYKDNIRSQKNWGTMDASMRISSRKDRNYTQDQYQELLDICLRLESTTQDMNRQLTSVCNFI